MSASTIFNHESFIFSNNFIENKKLILFLIDFLTISNSNDGVFPRDRRLVTIQ